MSSEVSPAQNDPLFGNAATDLLREAAGTEGKPPSDPRYWQPPTPEELQSRLTGYVIEAFLARGGMGAVYRGMQTSLERAVAIKILPPQLSEHDASFAQRFKQEARAMAQLNHPGIVKVFDFGEMSDGTLFFIMEFIDGTDVAKMVTYQGRLSSAHAMAITAHVCDALQYAHENGIIHRDIKPANIMVGNDGTVKVADFGLAKSFNSSHTSLTMTGHIMGTLNFMAPETLTLGSAVDHRADIYAVGVMLYQMLTGRLPQGIFEMPSLLVKGLDPRYDQIIASAMREDRTARYQAVLDMRRALDAILTQPVQMAPAVQASAQPPTAPPPPLANYTPPRQPRAARIFSSVTAWLAFAMIVVLLGLSLLMLSDHAQTQALSVTTSTQPAPTTTVPNRNTADVSRLMLGNPAARIETLRRNGGSPEVEKAVTAALEYLKHQQNPDGSWGVTDRVWMTALALLAYDGRCESFESAHYGDTMMKGAIFLVEVGKKSRDGMIAERSSSRNAPVEHCMATKAFGQMYLAAQRGSKSLPGMREAFESGVRFIINSPATGPEGIPNIAFHLAWKTEALHVANLTGLKFDGIEECIARLKNSLNTIQSADGGFEPPPPKKEQKITGTCLHALQLLGSGNPDVLDRGFRFARQHYQVTPLKLQTMDFYLIYFDTRAFFLRGGDYWQLWNQLVLPQMLAACRLDGSISRLSKSDTDQLIGDTAMCALILETYFQANP